MKEASLKTYTKTLPASIDGCQKAAEILRSGGIVALPTETVYGLAGNALSKNALKKIYEAKNRPKDNPLIWHVDTVKKAFELFDMASMGERKHGRLELLARNFWPGPLTIVAKKSPKIISDLPTIAVRIPKNPIALQILSMLEFPLAMPSANLSSRPSPTTAAHVILTLNGRIDAVLDGGSCAGGLESTVVLLEEDLVKILRPGLISKTKLESILKEELFFSASHKGPISPGQTYLHYAPEVKSIILLSVDEASKVWRDTHTIIARKCDEAELRRKNGERPALALTLGLNDEPHCFAAELYAALYRAEERPEQKLALIRPPAGEDWVAILDRLTRSSGRQSSGTFQMIEGVSL